MLVLWPVLLILQSFLLVLPPDYWSSNLSCVSCSLYDYPAACPARPTAYLACPETYPARPGACVISPQTYTACLEYYVLVLQPILLVLQPVLLSCSLLYSSFNLSCLFCSLYARSEAYMLVLQTILLVFQPIRLVLQPVLFIL